MNFGISIILKKNQLKMSLNFLSQLSLQVHFCDEPDQVHEGYSPSLFCLVSIETDESEKYKHLSSQATNEIV